MSLSLSRFLCPPSPCLTTAAPLCVHVWLLHRRQILLEDNKRYKLKEAAEKAKEAAEAKVGADADGMEDDAAKPSGVEEAKAEPVAAAAATAAVTTSEDVDVDGDADDDDKPKPAAADAAAGAGAGAGAADAAEAAASTPNAADNTNKVDADVEAKADDAENKDPQPNVDGGKTDGAATEEEKAE